MRTYNYFVSRPKFAIFLFNGRWIAVNNAIYRLSNVDISVPSRDIRGQSQKFEVD